MTSSFNSSSSHNPASSSVIRFPREVGQSVATAAFMGLESDLVTQAVSTLKRLYQDRELFSVADDSLLSQGKRGASFDAEAVSWETGGFFGFHSEISDEFRSSHRVASLNWDIERGKPVFPSVALLEVPVGLDVRDLAQSFAHYSDWVARRRESRKRDVVPQHLSAVVTVLDARRFYEQLADDSPLVEESDAQIDPSGKRASSPRRRKASQRGSETSQEPTVAGLDEQWVADTLIFQLEMSTVVLLMHSDSLSVSDLRDVEEIVMAINPAARILRMTPFDFRLLLGECSRPLSDGPVDLQSVTSKVGWKKITSAHPIRKDEFTARSMDMGQVIREPAFPYLANADGLDWVIYRRRRPFHPARFKQLLDAFPPGPIRAVGQVWIASFNDLVFSLTLSGPCMLFFFPEGPWTANCSESMIREMVESDPEFVHEWDPIVGDRLNELVLLCETSLLDSLVSQLDRALLTDEELRMDWKTFEDPIRSFYTGTTHVPDALQHMIHFPSTVRSTLIASWRRSPSEKNHLRLVREAHLSDLLPSFKQPGILDPVTP